MITVIIKIAAEIINDSSGKILLNRADILDSVKFCPEITSNKYTIVVIENNSRSVLKTENTTLKIIDLVSLGFKTLTIDLDNFKNVDILLITSFGFWISNTYIFIY